MSIKDYLVKNKKTKKLEEEQHHSLAYVLTLFLMVCFSIFIFYKLVF